MSFKILVILFFSLNISQSSASECKSAFLSKIKTGWMLVKEGTWVFKSFKKKLPPEPILASSIKNLELLSPVTKGILRESGINYLGDLVLKSESDLLKIPNFENANLVEVKEQLSKMDLQLGMSINWPSDSKEVEELVIKLKLQGKAVDIEFA